jgi:hypothetical protein
MRPGLAVSLPSGYGAFNDPVAIEAYFRFSSGAAGHSGRATCTEPRQPPRARLSVSQHTKRAQSRCDILTYFGQWAVA